MIRLYRHDINEHGIQLVLNLFQHEGFVLSSFKGIESVTKILPYIDSKSDYMDGTYDAIGALKSRCEALVQSTFGVVVDLPIFYPTIIDVMIKRIVADDGFLAVNAREDDDVQLYGSSRRDHGFDFSFNCYGMVSRKDGFLLKASTGQGEVNCSFPEMLESDHFSLKERCESIMSGVLGETINLSDHFYHCIIYQSASKMFTERYSSKISA